MSGRGLALGPGVQYLQQKITKVKKGNSNNGNNKWSNNLTTGYIATALA